MTEPHDMPADPQRPIPVLPHPAVMNCNPTEGMIVDGKPATVLRFEIITTQGSAFVFMTPDQLLQAIPQWAELARTAKSGLVVAQSPLVVPNGHGPVR